MKYETLLLLPKWVFSHLDLKEIKPVNPKGNQPWISIGGNVAEGEAEAEALTLATWGEKQTNWKRFWCWERLKAGGESSGTGRVD